MATDEFSNDSPISLDYFLYLVTHEEDWDGNDLYDRRKQVHQIMLIYLLREVISLVMQFFPTIEWQWAQDRYAILLSRPILCNQQQTTELIDSKLFVRRKKRCEEGSTKVCCYCGSCRCHGMFYTFHNPEDDNHRLGRFVRKNANLRRKHEFDLFGHYIQLLPKEQMIEIT